jgi:DNA gyrase subunit A
MGTLRGVVKKVMTSEFQNARTRGIIGISLDEGDTLVSACKTSGNDEVVLITKRGQALRIAETDVRSMGRASRGVTGIKLESGDELAAMLRVSPDEKMLLVSENGYGKRVEFSHFNVHGRATRGQVIYVPDEKTGELSGAITVNDDNDVMVITSQGKSIKFAASDVSVQGKAARGVKIVTIERPDFVTGLDKIIREEEQQKIASASEEGRRERLAKPTQGELIDESYIDSKDEAELDEADEQKRRDDEQEE